MSNLITQEDDSSPESSTAIALPQTDALAELKPGKKTFVSRFSIAHYERQERQLVQEFELTNVADAVIDLRLSGKFESKADETRNGLALNRLLTILDAKEKFYGTASPEVVSTLIYVARFGYHRANRFRPLDRDVSVKLADDLLDKAIAIVEQGYVSLSELSTYEQESDWEKEIGGRFVDLVEQANASQRAFFESLPLRLEKANGIRFHSRLAAKAEYDLILERLMPASLLVDQSFENACIEDKSTAGVIVVNSKQITALNRLLAYLLLEAVQDQLVSLVHETTMNACSLSTYRAYTGTGYYTEDQEVRFRDRYKDYLREREVACNECSVAMQKSLELVPITSMSKRRMFQQQLLHAVRLFNDGKFAEALTVVEDLCSQPCPNKNKIWVDKFAHEFRNVAFRFREQKWNQGSEVAYYISLHLTSNLHGENYIKVADIYKDLGHLYLGGGGYYEKFIHPKFGQGNPYRQLDRECFIMARESFQKAHDMFKALAEEADAKGVEYNSPEFWRGQCEDEIAKIDRLLNAARQKVPQKKLEEDSDSDSTLNR